MKTTQYFNSRMQAKDRTQVRPEWIERALSNPYHKELQPNGRWSYFVFIEEQKKFLRVVIEDDFVHNAYLDRTFTRKHRHAL
jgi:hypothetical protein